MAADRSPLRRCKRTCRMPAGRTNACVMAATNTKLPNAPRIFWRGLAFRAWHFYLGDLAGFIPIVSWFSREMRAPGLGPVSVMVSLLFSVVEAMTVAPPDRPKVLIIGGTGRIGTAVATHLCSASKSPLNIVLAGRDAERGRAAVQEVMDSSSGSGRVHSLEFQQLDYRDRDSLEGALREVTAVVHTAGPYASEGKAFSPEVLRAAIDCQVPCYCDLSDPVDYLKEARAMGSHAKASGTLALCAAGAFPGLSNVLAMECASRLEAPVKNLDFKSAPPPPALPRALLPITCW